MTISKKIYLILPLSVLFLYISHSIYADNTFLYDDAPSTLSYLDSTSIECPNTTNLIKREEFPNLVLNLMGNCIPILHTERTGAFAFNIVNSLTSFFGKQLSLQIYKSFFSILLLILYLNLIIEFSKKIEISPYITTLLLFFSPYFFFIYEPYLVEKMIPTAIVLIHLILFSKREKAIFLAGLLSSFCLFFIKLTFLFELIPLWILHFLYFKNKNKKYYSFGFLLGLLPLFIFNFSMFTEKWFFLAKDIATFENGITQNIPILLELIFIPSSFYLNGLFFQPDYLEITEYIPLLAIPISIIISTTYGFKKKKPFSFYLLLSFLLCFVLSFLSIMSKAKGNSVIYISSIGLYIPIMINYGFTRFKESKILEKTGFIIQFSMIALFFYTISFQVPGFEIISNKGTKDYIKASKVIENYKIKRLIVDDIEKLNAKYLIPGIDLYAPEAQKSVSSGNRSFAILSRDLSKFHPYAVNNESYTRFNKSVKIINKRQGIKLYLFLERN